LVRCVNEGKNTNFSLIMQEKTQKTDGL